MRLPKISKTASLMPPLHLNSNKNSNKALILIIFSLLVHGRLFATNMQIDSTITLNVSNARIEDVVLKIEEQAGVFFYYSTSVFDGNERITIALNKATLKEAMDKILAGKNLEWVRHQSSVIIRRKGEKLPVSDTIPQTKLSGRIIGKDGKPLSGATILIKGSQMATASNASGYFEFNNINSNATLVVSSIGYEKKEVRIRGSATVTIELSEKMTELKSIEVVSTGYQDIPRERSTGSFVQLDNKAITRAVSTDILDRILNITNSLRNETVGRSSFTIRGLSTLNANAKPLIVVDGFPYDEFSQNQNSFRISLSNLNPNDIESITILRDAAAASIWGARAANGVIVINTKKGKYSERVKLQFTSSLNIVSKPDILKANIIAPADAIEYSKDLFATGYFDQYNGPFTSTYSYPAVSPAVEILLAEKRGEISKSEADRQLELLSHHDLRNDVNKHLLRTAFNQQYNINVSGGGEKFKSYGSVGYDRNLSTNIGSSSNRITIRFDNSYRPLKSLELSTFIQYTRSENKNNGLDYNQYIATGVSYQMAPYTMLLDEHGNPNHVSPTSGGLRKAYIDTLSTKGLLDWHYRPLEDRKHLDNVTVLNSIRAGGNIKYTIIPGLSAEFRGQFKSDVTNYNIFQSNKSYATRNIVNRYMFLDINGVPQYPVPNSGILDYGLQVEKEWNIRGMLNFNKNWGSNNISAIAGVDASELSYRLNQDRKYGYDNKTLSYASNIDYNSLFTLRPAEIGATIFNGGYVDGRLNRFLSYYGNAAYTYDNRYTISGSVRIDASNFFGIKANLRYVPLWSVGGGWNILNESFINSNEITNLKVRLTYGYNGNLDNSATALPTIIYNSGFSVYNNSQPYAVLSGSTNPGLTWEKVGVINGGIDFGFFKNRLSGSLDVYQKNAKDLIAPILLDRTAGFASYRANYASIKVSGIDINLNAILVDRKVKVNTNLLFSYNTDKLINYQVSEANLKATESHVLGDNLVAKNKPRYALFSYRWGGLDPANGDPMGIVQGQKVSYTYALGTTGSEKNMKLEDLVYNGRSMAPIYGSWINTISFKNLSMSFNITYKFGYYFRRNTINYNNLLYNWSGHSDYSLRWKKPGDELSTTVPSNPLVQDNRYDFYQYSEVTVERGDYIRLQDIRVSYEIDRNVFKKLPLSSSNIFIYANNLGLLWRANKKGLDPDAVGTYNIPINPKSLAIGLTVNF